MELQYIDVHSPNHPLFVQFRLQRYVGHNPNLIGGSRETLDASTGVCAAGGCVMVTGELLRDDAWGTAFGHLNAL
jgi:hypothetical protein